MSLDLIKWIYEKLVKEKLLSKSEYEKLLLQLREGYCN